MPDFRLTIIPVTEFQQNCTLLFDRESHQAMVFDPGGEVERILEAIAGEGMRSSASCSRTAISTMPAAPPKLRRGWTRPPATPRIEIWGPHEDDRFLLERIEAQQRRSGWRARPSRRTVGWPTATSCRSARSISTSWTAPAIRPAASSTSSKTARFAMVGDVLFRGSVGRSDFAYGDHATR